MVFGEMFLGNEIFWIFFDFNDYMIRVVEVNDRNVNIKFMVLFGFVLNKGYFVIKING